MEKARRRLMKDIVVKGRRKLEEKESSIVILNY